MPTRFYSLRTACRSWLLALGFALLALVPAVSFAQSACTAMWGIVTTGGAAPSRLGFFNNSAGTAAKFTTLSFTLAGGTNANALAGFEFFLQSILFVFVTLEQIAVNVFKITVDVFSADNFFYFSDSSRVTLRR